jgi:N-methylhydantoinase B
MTGGKPGSGARFVIRLGTAQEHATPSSGRYEMQAGERFLLQSAGGGGYGDPRERDAAVLSRDIAEGYLSAGGAKKDYG